MQHSSSASIGNRLLAALPPQDLAVLLPMCSRVALSSREPIYTAGAAIKSVYFPTAGMFSLVANLSDGTQAEVGIIGREGMLGTSVLSGIDTSFVEAMVQMPGAALRLSVSDIRHEFETAGPLRTLLLRYGETLQAQVMQTAACNGRHSLEQRLARWLLMAHDRADHEELPLTQEFIAMMLGVHRPSITLAARILQRAGQIRYAGGRIAIMNRAGLEAASCECYRAVQRRFVDLLGSTQQKHV